MIDFSKKKCIPCEGGVSPMKEDEVIKNLDKLTGWSYIDGYLVRQFDFKNYDETLAFFNATTWISKIEDHHPDILIKYDSCKISYRTHAINGISENDFICAAKLNRIQEI